MTSGEPSPPPDGPLSPEEVSGRDFPAARKGYDRAAVRAFLETVASTIEVSSERIADLERRLARAAVTSGEAAAAVEEGLLEAVSAEEWRDDVLADLDRRRRELNAEVVRLRAGRDRLRAELGEVMSDVAEQIRRLDGLLQTAREAGDVEEQRVRADPDLSVEERRAELEAARLAGFVTVSRALLGPGDGDRAEMEPAGGQDPDRPADVETFPPDGIGAGEVDDLFARLRAERTGDG